MNSVSNILLPTAYFPPVSYFASLLHSESILIEQMESFPKQTFRNRCEILTSSGKLNLVVPVSKPDGNHTFTKDILISYREPWNHHHWKSIQTAYRSSPYFNYYTDIFQPLFESTETSLLEHNREILSVLCKVLKLKLSVTFTDDYFKQPDNTLDLRLEITPKKSRPGLSFPEYQQVFSHLSGFIEDLSILDLLFNKGPDTIEYLRSLPGLQFRS